MLSIGGAELSVDATVDEAKKQVPFADAASVLSKSSSSSSSSLAAAAHAGSERRSPARR